MGVALINIKGRHELLQGIRNAEFAGDFAVKAI